MTELYNTPEEFDCWFCGARQKRHTDWDDHVLCDQMVCDYCSIEDEKATKINAVYAELCAELVALRQYRARVKPHCMSVRVDLMSAEAQFQKFENPVNPVSPAAANEPIGLQGRPLTATELMEEAIGRKIHEPKN